MSMACPAPIPGLELVDLRQVTGSALIPLLDEQIAWWRRTLHWDFSASAELVVRFVNLQSLYGCALLSGSRVAGYAYYILEDHKGLIGDVYMLREFAAPRWENRLIECTLDTLLQAHRVRRVESQLLLIDAPVDHVMPYANHVRMFRRTFMMRGPAAAPLNGGRSEDAILFEPWRDERIDDAARLVAGSYQGHVDSDINDQYQSPFGARKFLANIIQYPGCGRFCQPASFVVFRKDTGIPCGLILASMVSPGVGHITQVCVDRNSRGRAIGYEMLRHSIAVLEELGCDRVGLTVTASNRDAVRLYEEMGFAAVSDFAAHVWTGF
ncbi:MAG: GNAT family N-acetyltransferase [Bryobacterales bacterium]|nr:GNAT family N-acetyltransferase [Bryobacterales bacterium]